jgi:hypothetical protein
MRRSRESGGLPAPQPAAGGLFALPDRESDPDGPRPGITGGQPGADGATANVTPGTVGAHDADYRPCESIFYRLPALAEETAPGDVIPLIRQFYRALPPREALLTAISADLGTLMRAGGPGIAALLIKSIRSTCHRPELVAPEPGRVAAEDLR